jgi:hypothetical protein
MPRDLLKIKDLYLEKYKLQLKAEIEKDKEFLKIPKSLGLSKEALNQILDENIDKITNAFKEEYKDAKDIYYEFKTSKPLRTLYKNSTNNIKQQVQLTAKDTKVLTLYLLNEAKTIINDVTHPSQFRVKHLQNLIDNAKLSIDNQTLINLLEGIVIGLLTYYSANLLYQKNKKKYQKASEDTLKKNTGDLKCVNIVGPTNGDVSTFGIDSSFPPDNYSCPINIDNINVPHEPFDSKQNNFTCEVPVDGIIELDDKPVQDDISVKAIIESDFKNINVSVGDNINENTVIGNTAVSSVISPIIGNIISIANNSIVIDNISDPLIFPEVLKAQELIDLYKESVAIKDMINKFFIKSILPVMLSNAVDIDNLVTPIEFFTVQYNGVKLLYNSVMDEYQNIINFYEDNVKSITGQDNVKLKTENDGLLDIKTDIDEQERILYININLLHDTAIDKAKVSMGIIGDFMLKDYYHDLYLSLQSIESPVSLQTEYINKINDFAHDRDNFQFNEKPMIINEAVYIEDYFKRLFLKLDEINKQIAEITIDLQSYNSLAPYIIKTIDNEPYRYYKTIDNPENTCVSNDDSDNPYMSPKSKIQMDNIQYWLKYCGYATLGSVINYPTGWSTGFVGPSGPILFPVVYIPIKSIVTKYGFIVLGLTICGVYPFPWILISNFSSNYIIPIGDPTIAIKTQIKSFKKELTDKIKNFKNTYIKNLLKEKQDQINYKNSEITTSQILLRQLKTNKPDKSKFRKLDMTQSYSTVIKKIDYMKQYTEELAKWEESKLQLELGIETLKIERFVLEEEYKIIYDISTIGKSKNTTITNPKIETVKQTQKTLDQIEGKISNLLNKINMIFAALPISLKPMSTNFGPTIKKPVPKTEIETDLDDNTNEEALKDVTKQFNISNEILTSENFNEDITKTPIGNYERYTNELKSKMNLIVKKDSFPKYENLKVINLGWVKFIYTSWTPTGAKVFGIPGNNPL